jgi:hypothetical protein
MSGRRPPTSMTAFWITTAMPSADSIGVLRTGASAEDSVTLMTALLADGLARMARSSGMFTHSKLLWTADWHIRDETYPTTNATDVSAPERPIP